jgi:hypothetical protein
VSFVRKLFPLVDTADQQKTQPLMAAARQRSEESCQVTGSEEVRIS